MKRKACITIIVLGGIAEFWGLVFLLAGFGVVKYDFSMANTFVILGAILAVLGLVGIFGGIAGKRKANIAAEKQAEENAYQRALERIDPNILKGLREDLEQGKMTEEEFRDKVVAKCWHR